MTIAVLFFVAALMFFGREHVQAMVDTARKREAAKELAMVEDCCCRRKKT